MTKISRTGLSRILSPFFLLLLWYLTAICIKAPLILPYPHSVFLRFFQLAETASFWQGLAFSFLRVLYAFFLSFIIGFWVGLLSADFPAFRAFIEFPLAIIRVTPLISFILLAIFWFKSGMVAVFAAVLMALPVMISSSEKGFEKNSDNRNKLFKASCYGFSGFSAFRYIRFPSAMPSLLAGAESAFGICWKVIAAGEVISVPKYALGTLMQKAQIHLETTDLLAITLTLVLASHICQLFLKILLNKFSSKNSKKAL